MDKKIQIRNSTTDFLVFTKQNGEDGIEVRVHDKDVWLTQKSMARLFDCSTDNIGLHLKNIFASGELESEAVTEESSATASDGKKYRMKFYNLDAIISVGYRINSIRATQFRQWATKVLKTFAIQGYVLDKKRLENGQINREIGCQYCKELFDKSGDAGFKSVCHYVFGLCGTTGKKTDSYDYGRLVEKTGCIFGI